MVQLRPQQLNRFRRDAWLEINLDYLEFNLRALYDEFHKPLIPVLKADAYGHGANVLVKVLDTYDFVIAYAVASIDEALILRESTAKRIIVLGISPDWSIGAALENNIELTVGDLGFALKVNQKAQDLNLKANIHIKIDTGMNRIGFKKYSNFRDEIIQIESLTSVQIKSFYSHFADPKDLDYSNYQKQEFESMTAGFDYPVHPASTPAFRNLPNLKADYLRVGIELYGLENPKLKPMMSLFARISFIKNIKQGESVSYKRTWLSEHDTRIATLPLGYADGVPRALSNKIFAYCRNKKIQQVGLITMDQMMFDLESDSDSIKAGDIVELIGPHIPLSDWVSKLDTVSYELVCSLNLRLPKSYTR
jgi:alanine racemase